MFGLRCTRCSRPLTYPFTSAVFTRDGNHFKLKNRLPTGVVDGDGAVVVYTHNDCRRQGKYSAKIMRKRTREEARERRATVDETDSGVVDHLVRAGFDVTVVGSRMVCVLPTGRRR